MTTITAPSALRSAARLAGALVLLALAGCGDDEAPPDRTSSVPPSGPASAAPSAAPAPGPSAKPAAQPASAAPTAAPAPTALASAAEGPAAAPRPGELPPVPVDCDALITAAEIDLACGSDVKPATGEARDHIGAERTCSRRYASKDAGTLTVMVLRHASPEEARERFLAEEVNLTGLPEHATLKDLGDAARRYVKKGQSGDPIHSVEVVRSRWNVLVFSPKVTVGGQAVGPVCTLANMQKVAATVVGRLPSP